MLKIAVITRYFPSSAEPWQGRLAVQRLQVLAKRADVRVFYPHATYPRALSCWASLSDHFDPFYRTPGIRARYFDYPAIPLLSRPFNGRMAARVLLPHVRKYRPDLIYSFVLYPDGYAALQIGKELGVPVVTECIGSDVNRPGGGLVAKYTRRVLRETDFLLTVSEEMRSKIIDLGTAPEKTRAILNGCDLSVFHLRDRIEARRVLAIDPAAEAVVYVGRMDVKKGLRELVHAAAKLQPDRPALQVYMVGDGADRALLEQEIQAQQAEKYIHIFKSCPFDEVAVWMAASDLVTLPSYMEGSPNVIIEALACGRPVVATHVGGIPELMNERCGRLVPPRDADPLATAIAETLDRSWDARIISSENSRPSAAGASEVFDIFHDVLAKRKVNGHPAV